MYKLVQKKKEPLSIQTTKTYIFQGRIENGNTDLLHYGPHQFYQCGYVFPGFPASLYFVWFVIPLMTD